jgi:phage terminase large subunit
MSTTNAYELETRRPGRPRKDAPKRQTFLSDFCRDFLPALHAASGIKFPNIRYRHDPVLFAKEILGVEPWSKQIDIIEAVRDAKRVAVRSGHKVGKSRLAGILALWFYCSFRNARVVMTSVTSRQVDQILWREVRMLRARAGRCVECRKADPDGLRIPKPCPHSSEIEGDMGDLARTGFKSKDFREIVGFTARQADAVQGISGEAILYIVDEASGVPKQIYEAIEGNRAGGAYLLLLGNPTQNEGEHYDAFHSKERFYKTFTVSSEESPNVKAGREVIPGLATKEWLEEKKEEWGEQSPLYQVRIKGTHAEKESGKIFSLYSIGQAEERWHDTPAAGRLSIGIDPAGESGSGDEAVFAARRGLKLLELVPHLGLSEAAHLVQLLLLIKHMKLPRETPVVVVDADGAVGSKVYLAIRNYADAHPGSFEVVRVRGSERSLRQPEIYKNMRDALTASLDAWFREGGAIVEDTKLEKELHAMVWRQRADGKLTVIDKPALRKILGRSPDRYDALALSCWEPLALREDNEAPPPSSQQDQYAATTLDPYLGARAWERR